MILDLSIICGVGRLVEFVRLIGFVDCLGLSGVTATSCCNVSLTCSYASFCQI